MKIQKKQFLRLLDKVILNFTKRTNELASCVSLYAKERSSQKIQNLFYRFRLDSWIIRAGGKFNASRHLTSWVRYAHTALYRKSAGRNDRNCKELINLFTYPLINFKPAFTLAEVLITLAIIGIVAAMTIPNLITEHKKRTTVTKLQRAISLLNQAYKLSYDEVGEPESAFDLGPEEYFKTYWAPYIKVLTYCSSYSVCGYKKSQPFKTLSNEDDPFYLVTSLGRTTFLTSDGFLYSILTSAGDFKSPQYYVVLDLNGSQEPNTYGKDVFVLKRVPEKGVMPNGYNLSNEEVETGCSINTGVSLYNQYCAEKIRRAGWKIDKDYPWK